MLPKAEQLKGDAEGQQLRYCGIGTGYEDVIIKGNPNEMKVILRGLSCVIVIQRLTSL